MLTKLSGAALPQSPFHPAAGAFVFMSQVCRTSDGHRIFRQLPLSWIISEISEAENSEFESISGYTDT